MHIAHTVYVNKKSPYSMVINYSVVSLLHYSSSFDSNCCTCQLNTTVVKEKLLYSTGSRAKVITVTVW